MAHFEFSPSTHGLCSWCQQPRHLPRRLPRQPNFPCQQPYHRPRQFTCYHCHPCHHHVRSHVILHVINVWHGNWICDENYTVRDVNFRHRKRAWAGFPRARRHTMTISKRHGLSNLWRKFKERHEVWSVTLNTWCYLRSSKILFYDGFSVICDEIQTSWINRFFVVSGTRWCKQHKV